MNHASTGISGLDDVLRGGFPANRLYLVQGNPGVGKTTLALQFLREGQRRGERGLYITLSETKDEIEMVAASHGWSLEGLDLYELSAAEQQLVNDAENTLFNVADVELHEVMDALLAEVERTKCSRVVFDSLSELRLLAQEPLRYRRQILALKQFFAGRQCTVLLLDDNTLGATDLQLQSLAHGVLQLEQMPQDYGAERRRMRMQKLRGVDFRGGYHDYRIKTGGIEVYPRLIAAEHRRKNERGVLASGLPPLDQLLGGGLDRGASVLITGPAGCGKSTLATLFANALADAGGRSAIFNFEESTSTLIARSLGLGMDIQKHIDTGAISVRRIDPAEVSPGEFASQVRQAVEHQSTKLVIIDSLSGYLNAMPQERHLTLHMHELLSYLSEVDVTTIAIMPQHGLVGAMNTQADVSFLADTVILLRYFEARGEVRKALSVVKRRGGAHEASLRELSFDKGVHIGKPLVEFKGVLTGVPDYVGAAGSLSE